VAGTTTTTSEPTGTDWYSIASGWQAAERSGDYSGIASLLQGVDPNALATTFGFRPEDQAYLSSRTGYSWAPAPPPPAAPLFEPDQEPPALPCDGEVEGVLPAPLPPPLPP